MHITHFINNITFYLEKYVIKRETKSLSDAIELSSSYGPNFNNEIAKEKG